MAKPEIGLSMLHCLNEPFKSVLERLPDVAVKHIELVDEGLHALNKRRIKQLKQVAEANNLDFVVHAPWAGTNIAFHSPDLRRAVLKRLTKSLSYAAQLDCRLWLFHPGSRTGLSHFYPGEDWKLNLKSVRTLLRVARKEGVKVAVENTPEPFPSLMKTVDDFHSFYRDLDDEVGVVLDVAHANLNGQVQDFLEQFSSKIVHVHVSDNHGDSDSHLGIGYGSIDWKNVAKLIKKTAYGNLVMIESTEHVEESIQFLLRLFS